MSNPNEDWWGRLEPADKLACHRERVASRTAFALGVPLADVEVVETVEAQGVRLVAHWCPR